MGIIRQLDYETAVLVAAGEMIERPMSVVKELMENSIDAGATKLTVEIQGGGIRLIRVSDNGCGMAKEDLPLAIKRNATSKIRTSDDIASIMTLGFRGEALASIAACADFRIRSKRKEDAIGCELTCGPGIETPILRDAPMADGTTMIVENLFESIPARRKFLKKDTGEASMVTDLFEKLAISNPGVAMSLIIDGKLRYNTPGDGDLRHAIYAIKGAEFASKLLELNYKNDIKVYGSSDVNISVKGYIGSPDNNHGFRTNQIFYVNGRNVRSVCLMKALEQSFTSYMEASRYPVCAMFVEVPPQFVDVNIHPTKLEVKFQSEKAVFEAVYYAVRGALEKAIPRPKLDLTGMTVSEASYAMYKQLNAFVPIKAEDEKPTPRPVYNNQRNVKVGQLSINDIPEDTNPSTEPQTQTESVREMVGGLHEFELVQRDTPSGKASVTQEVFLEAIPSELDEKMTADRGKPVEPQKMYLGDIPPEIDAQLSAPREKCIKPDKLPSLMTKEEFEELRRAHNESDGIPKPLYPDIPTPEDFLPALSQQEKAALPKVTEAPADIEAPKKAPEYKIIGEAFLSYVIVEVGDKVMIIDKHAAHERIIFEELRANMKRQLISGDSPKQMLLAPITVELGASLADTADEYASDISAVGFDFDIQSEKASITAIPTELETVQAKEVFETILSNLDSGLAGAALTRELIFEKALYQASCKGAIKIGREYSEEHLKYVIEKLLTLDDIKVCPHGRPVAFEMTKSQIEHNFKRL